MNINRNILRSILVLSYVLVIGFIIYGFSALYSYLNTGADRSSMLHTDVKKIDQYLPKITWETLKNEGRPMDEQTLGCIETNYLDAWYVKHLGYQTNTKKGIDDYYTENARKNIYAIIDENLDAGITIESTTLQHDLNLEFFSEDGQLVVLTDKNVVEYKRIYKNETLILETTDVSTYKVILLLEDGFWRIRHMVKESSADFKPDNKTVSNENLDIKGINYYPQASPWDMFGEQFDADIISKDFKRIKDAGLNSIRIFVPYEAFGKANVDSEKLKKLVQVMDVAEAEHIKVMVTLFDFYGDYAVLDWTLNQRHAETIVSALKNHNALFAWDIKNEPNLDFESRNQVNVMAWLDHMINLVKSLDSEHPVTIGWSNAESATLLKDKVDVVSFHYYEALDDLEVTYKTLKTDIPDKPIAITEFGMSSYSGLWNPFGNSETDQADYHKDAQTIFSENNIPFMSWTLYDFTEIPKEVVGRLPWRKNAQKRFGFIDEHGVEKEAYEYINHP
ncbi:cellulase family glycosylhydrolase [Flavivirga amylovorans]|uniref:Cellulase family glycosylhydrolase n=2 Tax=Flavivirga amylovorans TaxID=870486 RepID=A0ABT8WYC6_9FLAO|nr:glycoside hydrolase family 2 TIM barrel-domain containing protein [Flavivirga amylovorans]MDO5986696.1 cellulase family glycosylhydrolase [Flavivirga amylovorans]